MSDNQLPPPPPRVGAFARLWTRLRGVPVWAQVVVWVLAWPVLAALLLVSTPPRPHRWRIAAAVVVVLAGTPVWATVLVGRGANSNPDAELAAQPAPAPAGEVEPEPEPDPDAAPEPVPDVGEVLAAELDAICLDALKADDRSAGRLAVREAAERLAPKTGFSTAQIVRAANQSCGSDILALGPRAPPEPEPEPQPAPESEPAPVPATELWTVVRVVDGDTVDVRRGSTTERVRVIGIDTPERGECGFGPASSALAGLVLDKEVALAVGTSDDRDRYDRILRYVDSGETDAGLHLIEQGLAIARYDSRDGYGRHPRQDAYVAADNGTEHVCGVTFDSVTSGSSGSSGSTSSSGGSQTQTLPAPGGVVKKSTSDICHAPGTTYYDRTKNFTPYDTVEACVASGGRLPKR